MNTGVVTTSADPIGRDRVPGLITLALLVLSFHIHGLFVVNLGGLNVTAWDLATLLAAVRCFIQVSAHGLRLGERTKFLLIFMGLFQMWMCVSAFVTPDPVRALTMVLLQFRNMILVFSVIALYDFERGFESFNRVVFFIGVFVSVISIALYIPELLNVSKIAASSNLWKPGIVYVLDQGGVLRLIGFARDPNFFSLWMSLSFATGWSLRDSYIRNVGLFVIGLSLLLALSRGFVAAVVLSILVLVATAMWRRSTRRVMCQYLRLVGIAVAGVVGLVAIGLASGGVFWEQILTRIELASVTPRFAMWATLLNTELNPLVGLGLRGVQEVLGGSYSHNTYLDIIFETGLIGMGIWGTVVFMVTIWGFAQMAELKVLPWVHTWLITLGMFASLSLAYNPFPWLVAAVLVGSADHRAAVERYGPPCVYEKVL